MKEPVLVIMAAGMGSRYGGLKQMDPMDKEGHFIMDFSIYDAKKAGFKKVIFIIKKENEELFRSCIGDRVAEQMEVSYVFQEITNLPDGYEVPQGRVKPWGTGHAVLCCKDVIDGPFAVINADDYYGREAFSVIYDYLVATPDQEKYQYTMVSYLLENTLTENGHVSRGVCEVNEEGYLTGICERTRIEKKDGGAAYTEDDGETWTKLAVTTPVSMNMWGFQKSFLEELQLRFSLFLDKAIKENPMKGEYFLPSVVGELLLEEKAEVKVLSSKDRWYGVTYKEDKEMVMQAIADMKENGLYPDQF